MGDDTCRASYESRSKGPSTAIFLDAEPLAGAKVVPLGYENPQSSSEKQAKDLREKSIPCSPGYGIQPKQQTTPFSSLQNPRDWSRAKKWTTTLILSAFAFLQPLTETMLAPVEKQVSKDLNIRQAYEWLLCNSLILIGVGLGPLLLAPLSEAYGRKPVILGGGIIYLIWNTACGGARNFEMMAAFRLLSGFGACVADAITGGVLSDLWRAEERGTAFAIFMAAPLLGPALGPICGAFISEGIDWRWIFWITSIASGTILIIAIFFLHETYEPVLQRHHIKSGGHAHTLSDQSFMELMRVNLQRPFRMLATQLIVQLLATYMALLYGTIFLFLFMCPRMWTEQYNQSIRIGSLNYISVGIGLVSGVVLAGYVNDRIYLRLKIRNNNIGRPEFRVPSMVIGTALVPIGLLWWGWSGQSKLHWIMPNIGSLIFAVGAIVCSGCVSVYTMDAYTKYAASAISTNLVTRSITAAFFPMFAPYMFDELGFGVGATVLAAAFALVGVGAIVILWFYGERIRAKSTYCANTDGED